MARRVALGLPSHQTETGRLCLACLTLMDEMFGASCQEARSNCHSLVAPPPTPLSLPNPPGDAPDFWRLFLDVAGRGWRDRVTELETTRACGHTVPVLK
jgi:hypothetical protein